MFAKLRPHHHRRSPSNPISPADQALEQQAPVSTDHALAHAHAHPQQPHPQRRGPDANHTNSISEPAASQLPGPSGRLKPITRAVTADGFDGPWRGSSHSSLERDPYAFSNLGRVPYVGPSRPESAGHASPAKHAISPQSARQQQQQQQAALIQDVSSFKSADSSPAGITSPESQASSAQSVKRSQHSFSPTAPSAEHTQSKSRLNLLNPMSLLARRRTSQAVPQLAPQPVVVRGNARNFNETFDPRIRGTVVHDFSAPRPRKDLSNVDARQEGFSGPNLKYQQSASGESSSAGGEDGNSPWSGGNHTPVFTENFEEEQYPRAGPHVRKVSDLTDLPLPQPPYAKGVRQSVDPQTKNFVAQKPTQDPRRADAPKPVPDVPQMTDHPPPVPPKPLNIDKPLPVESRRNSVEPALVSPKAASGIGRPRNRSEVSIKDAAAIPKHMRSTSSRFSFDIIGAAKQEKLLEERHRKKTLEKEAEKADGEDDQGEDGLGDDYDYDEMDDYDGLEERIPGVNAELEDDDYPFKSADSKDQISMSKLDEEDYEESEKLVGFVFQQSSSGTPMSPVSPAMLSTPRDADGEAIGFAMTKDSPTAPHQNSSGLSPTSPLSYDPKATNSFQGLGFHGLDSVLSSPLPNVSEFPRPLTLDDDDLYFDDGIISGPGDGDDEVEFDESVFDNIDTDEYGRPLRMLSSLPTLYSPPMLATDFPPSLASGANCVNDPTSPTLPTSGGLAPQPSVSDRDYGNPGSQELPDPSSLPTQTLTQDSLAAYQSALAEAAFAAAANGKFRHHSMNQSETDDAQPGLINDSSQTSHPESFSPTFDQFEDDFNYDDVLEDDPIIAAANAEALANDDDGFYGQEFGFYSASGEGSNEFGGYFGPRGSFGVARGLSNRVASREPNLTPITERSEYSNRNSFMSLAMHSGSGVASPGLAQLTNMLRSPVGDYENADMSFEALLKLRNRAWGGSQVSLQSRSSNGGSPKSAAGADESALAGAQPPAKNPHTGPGHRKKNSKTFSLHSDGASATSSPPASPTMSMAFSPLDVIAGKNADATEKSRGVDVGRDGMGGDGKGPYRKQHRHTGSNDSISYLKEESPDGGRWVLERRWAGESGEETLAREVVQGGI